jgi:hypothetical protein
LVERGVTDEKWLEPLLANEMVACFTVTLSHWSGDWTERNSQGGGRQGNSLLYQANRREDSDLPEIKGARQRFGHVR